MLGGCFDYHGFVTSRHLGAASFLEWQHLRCQCSCFSLSLNLVRIVRHDNHGVPYKGWLGVEYIFLTNTEPHQKK